MRKLDNAPNGLPMRKRCRVVRWSESGQSLIEVAVLLPFLALLMLGVIELGRYAYIGILVGNAARAGAAYGTESLPQSVDTVNISLSAQNDFQNNGQSGLTVSSSVSCGCDSGGSVTSSACVGTGAGTCASGHWVVIVSVTASGTFNSLFNYPGIPASITISRTSSMRVRLV